MKLQYKKMTAAEYLKALGISIKTSVLKQIKTTEDLDAVMDASYVYDKMKVSVSDFNNIKKYLDKYFNDSDEIPEDEYVDLSESLTAQYCHYLLEDLQDGAIERDPSSIVHVTGLEDDENAYYDVPPEE